jgi:hypothetical protein
MFATCYTDFMTYLEKAVNPETLARIDLFRKQRGIRTRKQALEMLVLEAVMPQEHPLTIKLRNAPKAPKGSVSPEIVEQILQIRADRANKKEIFTSLEVLKEKTLRRQRERSS